MVLGIVFTARRASTTVLGLSVALLALSLAACGGDGDGDPGTAGDAPSAAVDRQVDTEAADAGIGAEDAGSGDSMATLTVEGEVYSWDADQSVVCSMAGTFPVNAEFREAPLGEDGDWFQFLDRGDGGINFSAVLGGGEYAGTGAGEADEIRSDGFTYTGSLNLDGQTLDGTIEIDARAEGVDADGDLVAASVTRYGDDSQFAGDDVQVFVGDPGNLLVELADTFDIGTAETDSTGVHFDGQLTDLDGGPSVTVSIFILC